MSFPKYGHLLASCRLPNVTPGHSNRVFSLKYDPAHENIIVTGGWDNTVQVMCLFCDVDVMLMCLFCDVDAMLM